MFTIRSECVICGGNVEAIWDLPKLPLTGIYFDKYVESPDNYLFNQRLQLCKNCDFLQLETQVDPTLLYQETYSHLSSKSCISASGNTFLREYIRDEIELSKIEQIVEIGCNDLYLLKTFDPDSHNLAGQDPIWGYGSKIVDGVKVLGGFAENCDYSKILDSKINLILSAHTFEHVFEPFKVLENINNYVSDDCMFVIEVPSANRMVQQLRFDQVFNQHVNYYTINSLISLFKIFGFGLKQTKFNFTYWGGTQLLIFQKGFHQASITSEFDTLKSNIILDSLKSFKLGVDYFRRQLVNSSKPILAYGAAQMLPILNYHTGSEFMLINKIVDDNPTRQQKYYPSLDIEIVSPSNINKFNEYVAVVTALDSSRNISNKLISLGSKNILLPLGCM